MSVLPPSEPQCCVTVMETLSQGLERINLICMPVLDSISRIPMAAW